MKTRRVGSAACIVTLLSALSCDRTTGPEAPFVPDAATLARAAIVHFELAGDSVIASPRFMRGGANLSILGSDAIGVTATGSTRTAVNGKHDLIRFNLALVDGLASEELRPPTSVPSPSSAPVVYAIPLATTVTGGSGNVAASSDWDGAPFSFLGNSNCAGQNSACFPWEAFAAPLRPGQVSPASPVGFVVDKKVTSFDVYVMVVADVVAVPTGVLEVTVTSPARGPLPAVKVLLDGSIEAVTDASGLARFASAVAGSRSITIPSVPSGCTAPSSQSANVVATTTMSVSVSVSCAPAALSISSGPVQFDPTAVEASSETRTITITNSGGSTSGILTPAITGAAPDAFAITADQCSNASLAAGATCDVTVALRPHSAGAQTATLGVSASPGGDVSVELTGSAFVPAVLHATDAGFNFGAEGIGGTTAPKTFTIQNTGGQASGAIEAAVAGPAAADFTILDNTCAGMTLSPTGTCTVAVVASPSAVDARNATLTLSASPGGTVSIALSAAGIRSAKLEISLAPADFGSVTIGQTASRSFTIRNTGGGASGPIASAMAGPAAAAFQVDPATTTCGDRLAGGAECVIGLHFTPTASGPQTATVSVAGAPGGSVTADLAGRGLTPAAITIDRSSHDFGGVGTGTSTQTTFTITNTGESDALALTTTIAGADAGDFARVGGSCPDVLAGGASCTIDVAFTPSALASRTGTLTVAAEPGGTTSATLSGTGLRPATLSLSETVVAFGDQLLPVTLEHRLVLTNTGEVPTGQIVLTGGASSAKGLFSFNNCNGQILGPSENCIIAVDWNTTTALTLDEFMTISANPGGDLGIEITGRSLKPAALTAPASLTYGNVAVGSSLTQTLVISNTGDIPSGVPSISVPPTSPQFAVESTTCTAAVAAHATCTISVRFTPSVPGTASGSISVSATPGGSRTVNLSGFGTAPAQLALSTGSIDYGHMVLGINIDRQVTISNTGTDPSGPLSITLSGGDQFSIASNGCGATLAGLQSCVVVVRYMPDEAGSHSGSLSVAATPGGSLSAPLSGSAEAPVAATILAPPSVNFGTIPVLSTTTRTITFKNVGLTAAGPFGTGLSTQATNIFPIENVLSIVGNSCVGATLAPGQSCTLTVQMKALVLGVPPNQNTNYSGSVNIQVPGLFKSVLITGHGG
jgi:hypothetical protein